MERRHTEKEVVLKQLTDMCLWKDKSEKKYLKL